MKEVVEGGDWSGHVEARLQPGYELDPETGIQVNINNHFELKNVKEGEGARRALRLLEEQFEDRLEMTEEIIAAVLGNLT